MSGDGAVAATQSDPDAAKTVDDSTAETLAIASVTGGGAKTASAPVAATAAGRSVVLPRKTKANDRPSGEGEADDSVDWAVQDHPRFETIRQLGEGGMGQVELALDQDIDRKVAVKKLRADQRSPAALLRFAEEVRVVGALEHPGIVPVHDVGVDEHGQHYAVLKFLDGETMETVIEKLKEGSPEHVRRFSYDYRAQVFLKVLEAVRFAHARGYIHRDIKPANIMIGPYGEVTVVDWGIAKKIGTKDKPASDSATPGDADATRDDQRLIRTRAGAVIGTPLYMSPEQASGKNDELDERSDIFSLCMVFYEFLALEHPLADKRTVEQLLLTLMSHEWDHLKLRLPALSKGVPCELLRVVQRGIVRDPAQRYPNVAAMERALQDTLDGNVPAECYITRSKRGLHGFMHWIDRHPYAWAPIYYLTPVLLLLAVGAVIYRFVR
ncbi:MAG: serine/threonine protein kinase [Myxococcales bacterium]|nr:serine/threonine protein kinase [Myxococcales bacterium]